LFARSTSHSSVNAQVHRAHWTTLPQSNWYRSLILSESQTGQLLFEWEDEEYIKELLRPAARDQESYHRRLLILA